MKVQGKRALAGDSFTVPGLAPVERLAALEKQRDFIEAEIAKAAKEALPVLVRRVHVAACDVHRAKEAHRRAEADHERVAALAGGS